MATECHGRPHHSAAFQHLELRKLSLFSTDLLPTSTLVYCVLIVFLVLKYKRQQKEQQCSRLAQILERAKLKAMPAPPVMPVIGHLHLMRDYQHNPWDGFNAIRRDYGDIVSLKMGVHHMVLLSSFELMNEVLIKKGDIFADRPSFPRHDIVFGGDKQHSLALCNWSNTHRARRKFCKRGVVPNKLSARNQLLERVISKIMDEFMAGIERAGANKRRSQQMGDQMDHWKKHNNHHMHSTTFHTLDKGEILFLTGDIFMKFLCDESRDHEDSAYDYFNKGCDFIFYDINQCYLLDFMPYLTSFGFGYSYLKQLQGITDYCRYYIDDNIFEPRREMHLKRRQMRRESIDGATEPNAAHTAHRGPASNSKRINEEEERTPFSGGSNIFDGTDENSEDDDYLDSIIRDHLNGASSMSLDDYKVGFADLLAGHAAVTNILMRLLGHLSLDENTQELIHKEAVRTKLTSLDQLPPLPVTEAALHEALRLASSPIVPHVAREDSSIGGYFVPKGSAILFNCYNVNLSPELWKRLDDHGNEISPRQYWPRRFLKESQNSLGEISYKLELPKYFMPFSVGPRQCLGYKMVVSISIAAAAYICSKYTIRPNKRELVERLLEPRGTVALNPLQECFELLLIPR